MINEILHETSERRVIFNLSEVCEPDPENLNDSSEVFEQLYSNLAFYAQISLQKSTSQLFDVFESALELQPKLFNLWFEKILRLTPEAEATTRTNEQKLPHPLVKKLVFEPVEEKTLTGPIYEPVAKQFEFIANLVQANAPNYL